MKLIMENWRNFINEAPDGDGPLGKYVFPNQKFDIDCSVENPPEQCEGTNETDTEIEKRLAKIIHNHLTDSSKPLPQDATKLILQMIEDGNYPDVFKFYTKGLVYRGMKVTKDFFNKNYGKIPEPRKWYKAPIDWLMGRTKKTDGQKLPFSPTTKPGYSPSLDKSAGSLVSSWSVDFGMAAAFGGTYLEDQDAVHIVLVADASKNRFIDTEPLTAYEKFDAYRTEYEVIGIGDIDLEFIYILDPNKRDEIES
tara:strand:+ start:273 stop:1028 length:756 start_codon:yes stop_codon:yes gene_type:complete